MTRYGPRGVLDDHFRGTRRLGGESEEELDEPRVEVAAAERADLVERVLDAHAALYGRAETSASKTSQIAEMRPASGISSPARPAG